MHLPPDASSVRGPLTLDEIGALLGCSRERVRQIEKTALEKMAKAARKRGLTSIAEWLERA